MRKSTATKDSLIASNKVKFYLDITLQKNLIEKQISFYYEERQR